MDQHLDRSGRCNEKMMIKTNNNSWISGNLVFRLLNKPILVLLLLPVDGFKGNHFSEAMIPKIQSGSLELLPLCKESISLGLEHGTSDPYHAGMEMRRHPHGFPTETTPPMIENEIEMDTFSSIRTLSAWISYRFPGHGGFPIEEILKKTSRSYSKKCSQTGMSFRQLLIQIGNPYMSMGSFQDLLFPIENGHL